MKVATSDSELAAFLGDAADVSPDHPVVVSKFIRNAKEIEFDAVCRDGTIMNYAISEHVENAGVHSGDATLVLPAQKLYVQTQKQVKRAAAKIAEALNISGPVNIQFMARDNDVKVIECNLRCVSAKNELQRDVAVAAMAWRVDVVDVAVRECTCRERVSGLRNGSKRPKIGRETTHRLL